jgi:hypothetical protein
MRAMPWAIILHPFGDLQLSLYPLSTNAPNGYKGFTATVLKENKGMIHVFRKHYPNCKVTPMAGGDITIDMDFE